MAISPKDRASTARVPPDAPVIAPRRKHGSGTGAPLSNVERAALIARLDTKPTKADWTAYERDLEARLA